MKIRYNPLQNLSDGELSMFINNDTTQTNYKKSINTEKMGCSHCRK